MGFSISDGGSAWIGVVLLLLAVPAAVILVVWVVAAGKRARDEVVEEDRDAGRDGPIA